MNNEGWQNKIQKGIRFPKRDAPPDHGIAERICILTEKSDKDTIARQITVACHSLAENGGECVLRFRWDPGAQEIVSYDNTAVIAGEVQEGYPDVKIGIPQQIPHEGVDIYLKRVAK